jgi:putative addiction module component (TIGR02574 family)
LEGDVDAFKIEPSYTSMMNAQLLSQARQLSVQGQLELVEALWDGIAKRNAVPAPTDAQKAELNRRLADHEANPDDVVSWSEVKAAALAHIRQ